MDRRAYTSADIIVVSLQDAVRKRTEMCFGVARDNPDLATNILRAVIDDALHPAGGGAHRMVDIEIVGDLRFTVTDDLPPLLDDLGEPQPGFYDSLLCKRRFALAAAAALSRHTLIEVRAGGRGWRQELTGTTATAANPFACPGTVDGTGVTFDLDATFLAPGSVISTSPERLRAGGTSCDTCSGTLRAETLTIQDRRPSTRSAPQL
ncbi:hypothetical protein [Actinocrispum sp. NPDC049592]|uniref:hypothetical protein n=1 Tax=Actinocrispum sp. NPDC049592 TaxID=3154835 RepID=UPI00343DDD79